MPRPDSSVMTDHPDARCQRAPVPPPDIHQGGQRRAKAHLRRFNEQVAAWMKRHCKIRRVRPWVGRRAVNSPHRRLSGRSAVVHPKSNQGPTISFFDALIAAAAFGAAASIVVFTLRIGISPMPSSRKARQAMLAAATNAPDGPIVDLGSAWGTLAIAFAKAYPQRQVIGYELSWLPWLFSLALKFLCRVPNVSFHRADFRQAPLNGATVLLCYLFRRGMQELEDRFQREGHMPPVLISNTFALPSMPPTTVITLDDMYRTRIYVYRSKAG